MAERDGDGWVQCRCGARHWGRHGAAGLLLARASGAQGEVLLQLRASWTHLGGTWALLGGARDSHEEPAVAALREAQEEADVDRRLVDVLELREGVDHGDWRYDYVLAVAAPGLVARAATGESDAVSWVAVPEVAALPLHPAFARAWPVLAERVAALLSARAAR